MITIVNPDGTTIVVGASTPTATNPATTAPATTAPATTAPATTAPATTAPATTAPATTAPATTAPVTTAPATTAPATTAPANQAGNNPGQGVVIIHPNNQTPNPTPAPVAGPTTFVAQQTIGQDSRYFPSWVIGIIIFILLLLLAYGGYILYQSGKDSTPAPAPPTTTIVKVVNPGGSKIAIDPEARVLATEANVKADFNSQEISDLKQQKEKELVEENKKDKKSDCSTEAKALVYF